MNIGRNIVWPMVIGGYPNDQTKFKPRDAPMIKCFEKSLLGLVNLKLFLTNRSTGYLKMNSSVTAAVTEYCQNTLVRFTESKSKKYLEYDSL